jgi:hypothetical protein
MSPWRTSGAASTDYSCAHSPLKTFDRTRLAELAADSSRDIRDVVLTVCAAFPGWRLGQTWANVVRVLHPDLYEEMTGTHIDPFYRDDRVDAFRAWLMTRARTAD